MSSSLYMRELNGRASAAVKMLGRLSVLFFTLVATIWVQSLGQGAAAGLTDGLVAHFPLDGNASDITLNGHNATINGTPTFVADRNGIADAAFDFDNFVGTVSGNSYSSLPLGNSSRTIAAWVKTPGVPRDMGVFHYGTQGNRGDFHLYISGENTVGIGNGFGFGVVTGNTSINDNDWHHIVGMYDQAASELSVYVDGILDNQGPISFLPDTGTANPWEIGRFANQFGLTFDGVIDDLRIYNRTLSQPEISQLAQLDLSIPTTLSTIYSGVPFSLQFEASGGTPPYTWSVIGGQLPTNVSLTSGGLLSGTATEAGQFFVTVQVTDSIGDTADRGYELTVQPEGVFDLAADWSDTANPNGVWSYNGSPGIPLTTHWDDWDPTSGCCFASPQPAWAAARWPESGHVPVWLKVAADTTFARDFPLGKVIMHGSPAKAEVTWTSPIDDVITISGGVWLVDVTASRSMNWAIYLNGSRLTGGSLTPNEPRSSIAPFNFQDGSGGPEVLTQTVAVGDVITLEFEKTSTFASFVGVDLTILSSLDIVTTIPTALKLGEPFSQQLETVAGLHPISWSVVGGTLPPGMNLSTDGVLSGTPTELGTSGFTFKVVDVNGTATEKSFMIEVVLVLPPTDILIRKSGTIVVPGRVTDYFIVVDNTGQTTASNLVVRELLDPLENFSDPSSFTPIPARVIGNLVEWQIDDLQPGEARILTYSVTISPAVNLGDLVKGQACKMCPSAAGADSCKNVELACSFFSPSIPTGVPSFLDIFAAWFNDNFPSKECTSFTLKCAEDCKRLCPSDSSDSADNEATGAIDPNEKLSVGERFMRPEDTLIYAVHFENIGEIEAIDVFVTDVLDPTLDDSTLEILSPGASYDADTRTLRWELLGRNLEAGETDNVLFSIKAIASLPSGMEIRNSAEIQFEVFDSLVTPEVVNVIDTTPPECVMDALAPTVATADFAISWTGTDEVGEIKGQSIFVSEDGGTFAAFLEDTLESAVTFEGVFGKTYEFLCVAKDTAGNIEAQELIAEATTTLVANRPPIADAGPDQVAECTSPAGAQVTLDGSGSSDPDGDALGYAWTNAFGGASGVRPTVSLALGSHPISLVVNDGTIGSDPDTVTVEVVDTPPPTVTADLIPVGAGGDDDGAGGDDDGAGDDDDGAGGDDDGAGDDDDGAGDDDGGLRVAFACSDACKPNVTTSATLNGIPVTNGQVVNLDDDDSPFAAGDDDNGPAILTLVVTCTDAVGNETIETTTTALPEDG